MDKVETLTKREQEVAEYAANGLTNGEIGYLLGLDAETIKVHLRSIFKKLGIRRRNLILEWFPPRRVFKSAQPIVEEDQVLLNQMAEGLTDAEIAQKLEMSPSRVHASVARLRKETGFHTKTELAMWWMIHTGKVTRHDGTIPEEQLYMIHNRDT